MNENSLCTTVNTRLDRLEIRIFISLPMSERSDEDLRADIEREIEKIFIERSKKA